MSYVTTQRQALSASAGTLRGGVANVPPRLLGGPPRAVGAAAPQPLTSENVLLGGKQVMAWPMDPASSIVRSGSRLNKVLLLHLDAEGLDPETKERAADGIVAYSAVCTHAGCPVTEWVKGQEGDALVLKCPCHNSEFNPRESAQVVFGPAPRRLAALLRRVRLVAERRGGRPEAAPRSVVL